MPPTCSISTSACASEGREFSTHSSGLWISTPSARIFFARARFAAISDLVRLRFMVGIASLPYEKFAHLVSLLHTLHTLHTCHSGETCPCSQSGHPGTFLRRP